MELLNYKMIPTAMFGRIVLLNRGLRTLTCFHAPTFLNIIIQTCCLDVEWWGISHVRVWGNVSISTEAPQPASTPVSSLPGPCCVDISVKPLEAGVTAHCVTVWRGPAPHPTCWPHHHVVMDSLSLASWCLRLAILFGSALNPAYLCWVSSLEWEDQYVFCWCFFGNTRNRQPYWKLFFSSLILKMIIDQWDFSLEVFTPCLADTLYNQRGAERLRAARREVSLTIAGRGRAPLPRQQSGSYLISFFLLVSVSGGRTVAVFQNVLLADSMSGPVWYWLALPGRTRPLAVITEGPHSSNGTNFSAKCRCLMSIRLL